MYPHHLHREPRPLCCDIVTPNNKQLIEIILLYSEIVRDIETDFHRLERQRSLTVPILDDGGADDYTLRRDIDTAVGEAVARMTAYLLLPSPFVRRISTNHAHEWEEKNIYLAMPPNWALYDINPLRDAVHNYIVKSVEYTILAVALPQDAYTALCHQQAADYYDDINVRISARVGPTIYPTTFLG